MKVLNVCLKLHMSGLLASNDSPENVGEHYIFQCRFYIKFVTHGFKL